MIAEHTATNLKAEINEIKEDVHSLFYHLETSAPMQFLSNFAQYEQKFKTPLYRGFSTDSRPEVGEVIFHQCFSEDKSEALEFMFNGHENYKCLIVGEGLYGIEVYTVVNSLREKIRDILENEILSEEDYDELKDLMEQLLDDETTSYLAEMEVVCSNSELEVLSVEEVEEDEEFIIHVKGLD